jgi:two-component system, sensor histidine kinase and response regulator
MHAALVDPTRLPELRADYGDVADQLLVLYERTAAETLAEIRAALEAGDREEVRRLAHRLKGSARNVGATGMAEMCAALEPVPPDAPQRLAQIEAALAPTCAALRAALDDA